MELRFLPRFGSSRNLPTLVCLLAILGGMGCGRSSDSGAPAVGAIDVFAVNAISFVPGEVGFELNRPIDITFNRAVDFSTVTANTFSVSVRAGQMIREPENPGLLIDVGGLPAVGEFELVSPETVRFQPRCPVRVDLEDAGLIQGVAYEVSLPSLPLDGFSVTALGDGGGLDIGLTQFFRTPNTKLIADLFVDTNPAPPMAVVRAQGSTEAAATRLIVGDDEANPVFLERANPTDTGTAPAGFLAPLNLYSAPESRVDVLLVLDQPVNPAKRHLNNRQVRLEYLLSSSPDVWRNFPSDIVLERNCGELGAEIRIIPLGPLPQARAIRVALGPDLQDLSGQRIGTPLTEVARFESRTAFDPGTSVPGDAADEIFEPFLIGGTAPGSREDARAKFEVRKAAWNEGDSGVLRPSFLFENAGGPNGDFDVIIPSGVATVFDTTAQQFTGGPNGLPTAQQTALDGVLHVRNLTVELGAIWRVSGVNPVTILASGDVRIDGLMTANGIGAAPVFTLNSANLPELGAAGIGGGGRGGTGSLLTTMSTPRGGAGLGGVNFALGGGGGGGESGIATNSTNSGENRRAGGGGGGVFGPDTKIANGCSDESYIGLNAEAGHLGANTATGAVTMTSPPRGGVTGPGPFVDASSSNDFWGTLLVDPGGPSEATVFGELQSAWAGAGGGAGGDATTYPASVGYPSPNFVLSAEDKGAGGGGGGGSITILALGSISFGPTARIEVNGGNGAGGENTNFVNRVGGGSGGGSGGHVVLQSATEIDFSEVPVLGAECPINFVCLSIMALGGQGGVGANNLGGFDPDFDMSGVPNFDGVPATPDENGGICFASPRICAGGDGGPGVIQLHAPSLSDIIPPGAAPVAGNFREIMRPGPVGMNELTGVWDGLMLPALGDVSRARSKWIPLGAMRVAPGTSVPETLEFMFRGLDPVTGFVETTGGVVDALPPVVTGTLAAAGITPFVAADGITLVLDVASLAGTNDLYRRNPELIEMFLVAVDDGVTTETYRVVSASSDESVGELRLTLADPVGGTALATFAPGASVSLEPRFFEVSTDGLRDSLPDGSRVSIRFQAAPQTPFGRPDEGSATAPTSNLADLTGSPMNTSFQYVRFIVEFQLGTGGTPLTSTTPVPSLEFLRIPIRF